MPQPILRIVARRLVLVGANAMLPPFWCLPSMLLSGSVAVAGIALINAVANTGGFIDPYVSRFVKDKTGGTMGSFLALAALGLLSAVVCLLLRRADLRRLSRPARVWNPGSFAPGSEADV